MFLTSVVGYLTLGCLLSSCSACDHVTCYVCSDLQDGNISNCSYPLDTRNPYLNRVCCTDTNLCATDIIKYYGSSFYIRNCSRSADSAVGCKEQPTPPMFEKRFYNHRKCICSGDLCNANGDGWRLYGSFMFIFIVVVCVYEMKSYLFTG